MVAASQLGCTINQFTGHGRMLAKFRRQRTLCLQRRIANTMCVAENKNLAMVCPGM